MNETNIKSQGQKQKTSNLAIVSFILAVISLLILCGNLIAFGIAHLVTPSPKEYFIPCFITIVFLITYTFSVVLSVISLYRVGKDKDQPRRRRFAAGAVALNVVVLVIAIAIFLAVVGAGWYQIWCGRNLEGLGKAIEVYGWEFDGKYPTVEKWCDLLIEHVEVTEYSFKCPANRKKRSSYAFNKYAEPNSPTDMVLLFETKGGWNQFGGPELLSFDNHGGRGCLVLFNDCKTVRFVTPEQLGELRWEVEEEQENGSGNFRKPANDKELKYWLENMVWYHRFTNEEIRAATGLTEKAILAALKRFDIRPDNRPKRAKDAPLLVLPYPGGRHPRIGFLEGAIDPQRETKFSVFTPWDVNSYVVVDVPEAIWSNLGLTYLAHTHIDTIWAKQEIDLPRLEWNRRPDGTLDIERKLPNGIAFGVKVRPENRAVLMELWLKNGTDEKLSDLRVQNCVMTKMAAGFEQQSNDNKVFTNPHVACRSGDGKRWIITAWEKCDRPWGNERCPCFHSDPKFPDAEPGQTHRLRGWLSFYEGTDIEAEFKRIEATGWRKK